MSKYASAYVDRKTRKERTTGNQKIKIAKSSHRRRATRVVLCYENPLPEWGFCPSSRVEWALHQLVAGVT